MAGLRYAPEFPKGAADAAGRISTVNISSVTLDAKTRSQSPLNIGAFLLVLTHNGSDQLSKSQSPLNIGAFLPKDHVGPNSPRPTVSISSEYRGIPTNNSGV